MCAARSVDSDALSRERRRVEQWLPAPRRTKSRRAGRTPGTTAPSRPDRVDDFPERRAEVTGTLGFQGCGCCAPALELTALALDGCLVDEQRARLPKPLTLAPQCRRTGSPGRRSSRSSLWKTVDRPPLRGCTSRPRYRSRRRDVDREWSSGNADPAPAHAGGTILARRNRVVRPIRTRPPSTSRPSTRCGSRPSRFRSRRRDP